LLTARSLDAADMGYHFRDLNWQCRLRRSKPGHWHCDGPMRAGHARPMTLALDLDPAATRATLGQGRARLAIERMASRPDDTRVDLTRVPLLWAQALLTQAWQAGQLKSGTLDARLLVHAPTGQPLDITGPLQVSDAAFDTPDATIAGERLGARLNIDYRKTPVRTSVVLDGPLLGGAFLVGNAYVALPETPVALRIEGSQQKGAGWRLPVVQWHDGSTLTAVGSAAFGTDTSLQALDMQIHSADVAPLGKRYLSGWLAVAGLADLQMQGAADADVHVQSATLQRASLILHDVNLVDAKGRFRFEGLEGNPRFSATSPVSGALKWSKGQLYGLDFAATSLPIDSSQGEMHLRTDVSVPALGGTLGFDHLTLRPPAGDAGADIRFGLRLDNLDIGVLAKSLHWPAFQGQLSGRIPNAHYAGERLTFDGGLTMQLFGGTVQASSLAMERPFGVAPSLTADLLLDNIDLQSLTGVFDFGSITGRLAGRIDHLRLVDWTATAFDAELHTMSVRGVRRRISQRAVQNISSVGDASFTSTLQSRLIGLFNDFGYSRIGISCTLANEVCAMDGLHDDAWQAIKQRAVGQRGFGWPSHKRGSEGAGFTIVEGAGIPHLTVIGFNRMVDWPTLLERLSAASRGDVKPVVQ
ncbi:MAG: hypothetical protein JWL98_1880, partial [Xanthomonadaceae bacterium]|nr:hypothetical protein [Xanthomonadaceae bacterium]